MHALKNGIYGFLAKLLAPWQHLLLTLGHKTDGLGHDSFVPVRELHAHDRSDILGHLLALESADRYLRFGYCAQDAQIEGYVQHLDVARDRVYGIYNRKLQLIAMAHLAYGQEQESKRCAEFGGSVLAHWRGRGLGAQLFARAQLHARNDGIDLLFIHALSENTAMLHIAQRAGARVERLGSESDAYLALPTATVQSHLSEAVDAQIADTDYQLKAQAQHFWALLGRVSGSHRVQPADK